MERRRFLAATVSAVAVGLAGCTQAPDDRSGDGETKVSPESQPERTTGATETNTLKTETRGGEGDSAGEAGDQAWTSGGHTDGVTYSFSSQSPETGENRDVTDIRFDTEAGEVVVAGTISGTDSCRRATLGSVEYDESVGTLTVGVGVTDIEDCEAGATALVGVDYEGQFEVDGELPSEVAVSHDGKRVAGAAHESSSVSAPTRSAKSTE